MKQYLLPSTATAETTFSRAGHDPVVMGVDDVFTDATLKAALTSLAGDGYLTNKLHTVSSGALTLLPFPDEVVVSIAAAPVAPLVSRGGVVVPLTHTFSAQPWADLWTAMTTAGSDWIIYAIENDQALAGVTKYVKTAGLTTATLLTSLAGLGLLNPQLDVDAVADVGIITYRYPSPESRLAVAYLTGLAALTDEQIKAAIAAGAPITDGVINPSLVNGIGAPYALSAATASNGSRDMLVGGAVGLGLGLIMR